MIVRYLAIPFGVCLGFAPTTTDIPWNWRNGRSKDLSCTRRGNALPLFGVSDRRNSFENETQNHHNATCSHRDAVVFANSCSHPGTTSRRKALILSGATATAGAFATRTGALTIPVLGSGQQDSFRNTNTANENGRLEDAKSKKNYNQTSNLATVENNYEKLLESSNVYRVQTISNNVHTMNARFRKLRPGPFVSKVTKEGLLEDLQSKKAILLGEHHPEGRDHLLQAALIRSMYNAIHSDTTAAATTDSTTLVVGLEAVQRKFQPVLDRYCAGAMDEEELERATEWDSRWYWSFEAYRPIFHTCRELGIGLLALDIATEDRWLVEQGGLKALDPKILQEYVPDPQGFLEFHNTLAYQSFVNYTLRPPYKLQKRTKSSSNLAFSNFVERQMLRDEGMASAAFEWLSQNPNGILVGCIGINHATFGCGVQGRLEQKLAKLEAANSAQRFVASVLINPEPLNTGTELKVCPKQGLPPVNDDEDDDYAMARQIFVPNARNQVCIENSIEVQNYALQLEYAPKNDPKGRQRAAMEQAANTRQAKKGETGLGLSDYLVFSPKERTTESNKQ